MDSSTSATTNLSIMKNRIALCGVILLAITSIMKTIGWNRIALCGVILLAITVATTDSKPFDSKPPYMNRCRQLGFGTPNKYGSCPDAYGVRNGCCEPCTTCPPGQGTLPLPETRCFTTCTECGIDSFNDQPEARICKPCSHCEEYQRTTVKGCTPFSNADCSPVCNGGYEEDTATRLCVKQSNTRKHIEQSKEKFEVKTLSTLSDRDEGMDEGSPTSAYGTRRRVNKAEMLESPHSGIFSFMCAVILIVTVVIFAAGFALFHKVCRNREPREPAYEREDTTGSTNDSDTSSLKTPMLSKNENQSTRRPSSEYSRVPDGGGGPSSPDLESRKHENITGDSGDLQNDAWQSERHGETMRQMSTDNFASTTPQHLEPHRENLSRSTNDAPQTGSKESTSNEMSDDSCDSTTLKSVESGCVNVSRGYANIPANVAQQRGSEDETKELNFDDDISTTPKEIDFGMRHLGNCNSDGAATNLWSSNIQTTSQRVDSGQATPTCDSGDQPARFNMSRGMRVDTHVTCPLCHQRVMNPIEETNRVPVVISMMATEERRAGPQDTDSSPYCPECTARRQAPSGRQVNRSSRGLALIPEATLEASKNQDVQDIPLDVRKTVCHQLNGNNGALCKGLVEFAVELGISEIEARDADGDDVFRLLETQRVKVYRVLTALDKIKRDDAVKVIGDSLQQPIIEQS